MRINSFKGRLGGALLTLSILFGVGAATSLTTEAQWQWPNSTQRNREYEREQRRREREMRREQRRREREQRRNDGYYRNDGYNRNDPYYRNDGYNDPYYNDNNYYGGSAQLRQTALNAGYNNGIEEGRKDRQRGRRFDIAGKSDYQKATEDYSSRLGDRELYKQYFRQGFQNGYRAGYNGY